MQSVERRGTMTLLLVGIAVFVMAQLAWWLYFQNAYVERVSRDTIQSWHRDASLVNALLAVGGNAALLADTYPHLQLSEQGARVDPEAEASFLSRQERRLRMFAFECAGFVSLMLVAFALMGRRLRVERELKLQQQNFLSAVSHELKTPMSSMRLLVETVLLRPLPASKQQEYLRLMEGELSRLEQLSETVLASTRLEAGEANAPKLEQLDLTECVSEFLSGHRGSFEARGARINFTAPAQELPVNVDPASISLILTNLIDNAIKYSPGAEKPIHIELEGRGHLVRMHVSDQGLGIPAGVGQKVFERFYRVGSEMVRTAPGVGLGLHLVRQAAESMNGWIRHQPGPTGRGTCFTVSFPRRLESSVAADARPSGVGSGAA